MLAGQVAAADTLASGNHSDDTFFFVSDEAVGNGDTFEVTITSFDGNSIAGEAFVFDLNIANNGAIPEPSAAMLLGLGGFALLARRNRR